MSNQTKQKYETIYGDAGLIYLRAPAKYEPKDDGKKQKIMANRIQDTSGSQNNQNMDQTQANITL